MIRHIFRSDNILFCLSLAGKLQSELIHETAKEQIDLFKNMKMACATSAAKNQCRDVTSTVTKHGFNLPLVLLSFLKLRDSEKRLRPTRSSTSIDDLHRRMHKADETLRQIATLLDNQSHQSSVNLDEARNQLETVNQILEQLATKLRAPLC
jgi:hypothetical protein